MKPTPQEESSAARVIEARQVSFDDYVATLPQRTDDAEDTLRLNAQCTRVYRALRDLRPHTLAEIAATTGDPEGSISARIRECRAYLEDRKRGGLVPGPAAKGTVLKEKIPGKRGQHKYTMRLYRYSGAA